jgi:hypothetical protein
MSKIKVDKQTRDLLLQLQKDKRVVLEGNIIKVLEAEANDTAFEEYLQSALVKDQETRKKRLEITKQIQSQNQELTQKQEEISRINNELEESLATTQKAMEAAEKAKDNALSDLDLLQKRTQTQLIGTIVKVALIVIVSVGIITTGMYGIALFTGMDTQIIGSTWSNMLGILLTNAFSIVGTIMGVKYASEKQDSQS